MMKEPGGRVICVVGETGIGVGDDVGATETGGLVWEFPFVADVWRDADGGG